MAAEVNHSAPSAVPSEAESEDQIRDYAYHLYIQSGCIPGRELANWLEAKACLQACIPQSESHARLHRRIRVNDPSPPINESDVRDYAYYLYVQNGHRNDQCLDNWREAIACLECRIPKSESHTRLHRHFHSEPTARRPRS
jgi:hypothetical protein